MFARSPGSHAADIAALDGTMNSYLPPGLVAQRDLGVQYLVAMSFHDLDTLWHLYTTADLARALARELRLDADLTMTVAAGALFHDIGKLRLPGTLLRAPRALTDVEWTLVRDHPDASAEILIGFGERRLAAIVRSHHEMLDGSGYPDGLRGAAIPSATQIITVADAFDAMRYRREYRAGSPVEAALEELHRFAGTRYDPEIVDALTRVMRRHESAARADLVRRPSDVGTEVGSET